MQPGKQIHEASVRMFKTLFLASLFVTLLVNFVFLFATKDKPPDDVVVASICAEQSSKAAQNRSHKAGSEPLLAVVSNPSSNLIGQPRESNQHGRGVKVFHKHHHQAHNCDNDKHSEQPESSSSRLHIRVKSSKNHVFVSVDDLIIYESKSAVAAAAARQAIRDSVDSTGDMANNETHKLHNNILPQLHKLSPGGRSTAPGQVRNSSAFEDADADADVDADADADGADGFNGRGIHVVVLNEFYGYVMAKRLFDTYSPGQDAELTAFLESIRDGRILVLAIKDEGSFGLAKDSRARKLLKHLGSRHIMQLGWRDMWACVLRKSSSSADDADDGLLRKRANLAESRTKSTTFSDWARAAIVDVEVWTTTPLATGSGRTLWDPTSTRCGWSRGERHEDRRRLKFCNHTEGYLGVCDCREPARIEFNPAKITNSQLTGVPILVMASNRPYYLFRMLSSLLAADGVNRSMVTVFIDGLYEEPLRVSQLFALRAVRQRPVSRRSARISHHYKASLATTFDRLFPEAEFAIIFEEDLDVAPDALVYFNQTLHLLRTDPSLYCASTWNDQGYEHSTGADPTLVYRIETMPGLGWMLSRQLYKRELEPNWPSPDKQHDWDMWIRTQTVRKHRECLIPDISRTFHFGSVGTNINSYFQHQYFSKHALYRREPQVKSSQQQQTQFRDLDKLRREPYEQHMERLIGEARCINYRDFDSASRNATDYLCSLADDKQTSETAVATSSVIFIDMIDEHDYTNWLKLAKCWRIWDLDARGQHKSMWRLFLAGRPLFVVGVPASPYAKFKPAHVKPFSLT